MFRPFYLAIFISVLSYTSCVMDVASIDQPQPYWKEIPDAWIENARRPTYTKADTALINEFAKIMSPDTSFNKVSNAMTGFVFNVLEANLDGYEGSEVACLQGWDSYAPYLCVFRQVRHKWYLIYVEQISTFYSAPVLGVAGNYSKNKTLYLKRVSNHGSGVYADQYSFYKLEDNVVYPCLDIVNKAHIFGWGLFLNQSVQSSFEFGGNNSDELQVRYSYNFFPGAINDGDCEWCANEDMPLIKGEDVVDYTYDSKSHHYRLNIEKYKNAPEDLTADKIACFGDFGNDSLFVTAYKRHIDKVLKEGTTLQKRILKQYLLKYKNEKQVKTHNLEVKASAGTTQFYGPK